MEQELNLADTLKIIFFVFYTPYLMFKIVTCLVVRAIYESV